MEQPAGDCGNHAVLLASALRSIGIPSRIVYGIMQFSHNFAQHAWCEGLINGKWHAFDATMALGGASALNIKLGELAGDSDDILGLASSIMNLTEGMAMEVVSAKTKSGKVFNLRQIDKYRRITKTEYIDYFWNIKLKYGKQFQIIQLDSISSPIKLTSLTGRQYLLLFSSLHDPSTSLMSFKKKYQLYPKLKNVFIKESKNKEIIHLITIRFGTLVEIKSPEGIICNDAKNILSRLTSWNEPLKTRQLLDRYSEQND